VSGVVQSATYREGWTAGVNQAIIELEARATVAERVELKPFADFLRALANELRAVRDS